MKYVAIKNNKIVAYVDEKQKTSVVADKFIPKKNFTGYIGEDISFYDKNLDRYSRVELIKQGKEECPPDLKLDNSKKVLLMKTVEEKYQEGLIEELPEEYKLVNGKVVYKTIEEQLADGIIDQKEAWFRELGSIEAWLQDASYISEKIAEGRGTKEDYADIIKIKEVKCKRLKELKLKLNLKSSREALLENQ